jgi:hypothetical protein
MKKLLLSVICMAVLTVFSPIEGRACNCDLPRGHLSLEQQVKKARKQSQTVFAGNVVEILRDPESSVVVVKFRVESSWKGRLPKKVSVSTGQGHGDCGYQFEVGQSYLVYAYGSDENSLSTNICQRTAPLSEAAADIKLLGKRKLPSKAEVHGPSPAIQQWLATDAAIVSSS